MAADVAEWLRRLTRNQIPSGSVGSNPAVCDLFLLLTFRTKVKAQKQFAQRGARTHDPEIKSLMLYRLS